MEPAEHIYEEWSSLSGVYTAEEADFMNQLLGNCSVPEHHLYGDFNWGTSVTGNDNISYFPAQGSSSSNADSSNIFPTTTSGGNYYSNNQVTNFGCMAEPFSLGDPKFSLHSVQGYDSKQINENTDEEFGLDGDKNLQAHKECEILVSESEEDKVRGKRSRRSSIEVPKNKRNVKSKKNSESACISNTEEDTSPGPQGQTLSSYCSDDDSNASQELNGGASLSLSPDDSTALKLSGKSRSNIRVPATDPQSVYARRRRERINERLRILQKLVPNGTKVDISTMLEEAVQYVKFLQLQIKLLSSEDLWMYAPIAYNGMNIGLQLNITPTKQPKQMHT